MNMRLFAFVTIVAAAAGFAGASAQETTELSFFLTSAGPGNGADLGGLEGADQHCQALAATAGAGGRAWRAYLSTSASGDAAAVNARDRIGAGPWHNAKGVLMARDIAHLHGDDNNMGKETSLDENGNVVNGRGDKPNRHDILTGSQPDGTAFSGDGDTSCGNWTGSGEGSAKVGHHDLEGLVRPGAVPNSWNSAHPSRGCSQANLQATGGDGLFYCFAAD